MSEEFEEFSFRNAVECSIRAEQQGAKLYSWLAKLFAGHQELRDVFDALARDELTHAEKFAALVEPLPDPSSLEQQDYLRALFHSEVFFLFKNIEKIQHRDDALERALHMEKSALLCYQAIREILGEHPVLDEIIAEEKRHIVQIMKYLVTGAAIRELDDEYP